MLSDTSEYSELDQDIDEEVSGVAARNRVFLSGAASKEKLLSRI